MAKYLFTTTCALSVIISLLHAKHADANVPILNDLESLDSPQFHLPLDSANDDLLSLIDNEYTSTTTEMCPDNNKQQTNLTQNTTTLQEVTEQNIPVGADIATWSSAMYDFHGACDLVMLQSPSFQGGNGMDIHIRTKPMLHHWSYISSAVLRIGDATLEVMGGKENRYWINGVAGKSLEMGIAGYPIRLTQENSKRRMFVVDLKNNGESIVFKIWRKFVWVELVSPSEESRGSSRGLLGSSLRNDGRKIGRDKITIIDDATKFGMEWQVLTDEPMLFHSIEGVQAPTKCAMPDDNSHHRRLRERTLRLQDAEMACVLIDGLDHDACVYDTLATK